MTSERWARIGAVFGEALELKAADRPAYVERACAGDADLRDEILDLLARNDRPGAFVDTPPAGGGKLAARLSLGPPLTFQLGDLISNRFRIERFVGEGGMGEVYAALDTELGTPVAVKTMHPHLAVNEKFADRFRREIQIARQVTHPSVCRIFDAGRHNGTLYLTMELIAGETLAARLRRGILGTSEALPIIRQLCEGLGAAHAAGVIHRDLKSVNVILSENRAVITDFGLARLVEPTDGAQAAESTAVAIGTPAYMAPEQMEGAPAGPAADIYALGVVIYEMLTGHRPFSDGLSPLAMAVKKVKEPPTSPRQWTDLPVLWERVILKCLAIQPEDRFSTAVEIVEALEGGRSFRDPARSGKPRKWQLALVAAACLCAVAGWGLSAVYRDRLRPPAGVEAWYREGVHALHDGNPATSQRALARVTQLAPAWAPGHARMAQAYTELDQPDLARESILQALQVQSFLDPGANLVKAIQSQVARDFGAAAKGFERLAAKQSGADRLDALLDHARALEQGERPAEAVRVVNEILAADSGAPTANLMQAQLGIRLKDTPEKIRPHFDRALEGFKALNRLEALAQGQLELSKWMFKQKDANGARKLAETSLASARAAQSKYAEAQSLFHLAQVADSMADRPRAHAYLREAREIAGREHFGKLVVQGFIDLGIQLFTEEKLEMALTEFRSGVAEAERARSPRGQAGALHWSGRALTQLARFPEALSSFKQAVELHVSNGFPREAMRTRLGEAAALSRMGENPRAATIIGEVQRQASMLEDVDLQSTATLRLADLSANTGEHPMALANYRAWLEIANKYGLQQEACRAQSLVARMAINLGLFSEARTMLQKHAGDSRCQLPQHATARGLVEGLLLTEEGRFGEALRHYRAMLAQAKANNQKLIEKQLRNLICTASSLGESKARARVECGETLRNPAESREVDTFLYVSADLFLHDGNFAEAIRRADLARAANLKHGNLDDTLYSTLIRGQAEVRSGNRPAVEATRLEVHRLRGQLVARWGETAVAQYLTRPLYASRWNELFDTSGSKQAGSTQ